MTTGIPSLVRRILEFFTTASDNLMARARIYTRSWRSSYTMPINNWSRPDYDWWDRAYRGRVTGLGLSGLLIKPVVSKLAGWSLGRAPKWKVEGKSTQTALTDWWEAHHADVLSAWEAALKQGDAFLVINSDLSVTLLPPSTVDPIVDESDYSVITGWRVTQVLAHPQTTARMTVIDEYYADRRVHRVEVNGITRDQQTYPNLIGRLPFVHIANLPNAGEVFGHPECEGLVELLHKYGEVVDAAIEGNVRQGRPTPIFNFETMEAHDKFWELFGTQTTTTLPDGTSETTPELDLDLSQALTMVGTDFTYASPGNFTADTVALLQILYYLYLEHVELPEFVLGSAIESSKASADAQLPVLIEFIKTRRGKMQSWLVEIASIVLGYLALTVTRVRAQEPTLQWEALDQTDGQLTLLTIQWALSMGLIDEMTALILMPVEVEDPKAVLAAAKAEREEKMAEAQAQAQAQGQPPTDNQQPPATAKEMMALPLDATNGYNSDEAQAIVAGAIRIIAGEG